MNSVKFAFVLFVATLLTACAGTNFVKPADNKLVLGSTTKAQIVAMLGEPNFKGQRVSNGEQLELMTYAYATVGGEPVFEGVTPARSIGFLLHNGVLVGKEYTSSFKSDNTYFDPDKARSIKKGMTKSQVLALMGKPGGEYRYPAISDKNGKALVYIFAQTRGLKSQRTILVVELDANDIVEKSDFSKIGQF